MKRCNKVVRFAGLAVGFGLLLSTVTGCVSTKVEATEEPAGTLKVDEQVVVDWTDRSLGEISSPSWLLPLRRGNSGLFKQEWGIDENRVVKSSLAYGRTRAEAQTLSQTNFVFIQAQELATKVLARSGEALNSQGQKEALHEVVSRVRADMSGLRTEHTFWQEVRRKNAETGKITSEFVYYTIYSMDKETWANICRKYLSDIIQDPSMNEEARKAVGSLYSELVAEADNQSEASVRNDQQKYQEYLASLSPESKSKVEAAKSPEQKAAEQATIDVSAYLM